MVAKILLIEADTHGTALVPEALVQNKRYEIEWVPSFSHLIDRLYAASPAIPIVIVSAARDDSAAQIAVQHGSHEIAKERVDKDVLSKTLAAVIDRADVAEALFQEQERARMTLDSIGDAVICTDAACKVSYLNKVAERLTGWPSMEALGQPVDTVLTILDSATRAMVRNPMKTAVVDDSSTDLPSACTMVRRDGVEFPIEDSSAPIHDRGGAVVGAVMVFRDVSTSRAVAHRLAHFAQHDSLTDLPNRMLLNDLLAQALLTAQRHRTVLAVLYLDIDRFKHINDSLGHTAGDRVLQAMALRLIGCVRASDTVCRLGGDEFVVVLSEVAHAEDAAVCADKILKSLRVPSIIDGREIHVSSSIGIAVFPDDGADVEVLLKNADSAMYSAKALGRDRYQFYRRELNSGVNERQLLEVALRYAIDRDELELHYQPIMNLSTGACAGVEALLRWRHATRGMLLPSEFVGIAEESQLILRIGRWVLQEACRQVKSWQRAKGTQLRLCVNVSAVELHSKDFAAKVAEILADTGFDPGCLELELTEPFLMQDAKSTGRVLQALKRLGIKLALDDFGTGYSSLSHLRRFPVDTLKVDESVVRDLVTDAAGAGVVGAVIQMGRSLQMRVVAEGVETSDQAVLLREMACAEAQGFYFSPPLQPARLSDLMQPDHRVLSL